MQITRLRKSCVRQKGRGGARGPSKVAPPLPPGPGGVAEAGASGEKGAGRLTGGRRRWRPQARASGPGRAEEPRRLVSLTASCSDEAAVPEVAGPQEAASAPCPTWGPALGLVSRFRVRPSPKERARAPGSPAGPEGHRHYPPARPQPPGNQDQGRRPPSDISKLSAFSLLRKRKLLGEEK